MQRKRLAALSLLAALGWGAVARATDELMAVLPLDVTNSKLDSAAREYFLESLRTTAGKALGLAGYTVLNNETTLQVLNDNGVDAAKVCEASCALGAAREMNTSVFISGSATTLDDVH